MTEQNWSIHPLIDSDKEGNMMYVLMDDDGFGYLLGEKWQVDALLPVLKKFVETGQTDEPVDDEVIGTKYYTIAEACQFAYEYDPLEYPYHDPADKDRLRRRIQQNIRRGNIWGVKQDPQGFYKIRATAFRGWLVKNKK